LVSPVLRLLALESVQQLLAFGFLGLEFDDVVAVNKGTTNGSADEAKSTGAKI
jgi:hypothetical protein